jgi:hypothetical protein
MSTLGFGMELPMLYLETLEETMSKQPSRPQDVREWARRRELLQAVLGYLKENGPTNWAALYVHFEDGTGEIGRALGHLAFCKHIAIEGTSAKINALGMEQLKSRK